MVGTGFHSYNEYGDIIKNFKEEIEKHISPEICRLFKQYLLGAIRYAEYPCPYLELNDFVELPEFQDTMNYVLPVVKYIVNVIRKCTFNIRLTSYTFKQKKRGAYYACKKV